ncbi:YeeE/YedE family protein [Cellvibrio polysaccharolyticus]|uniref:YeeE/YedE family protein n=1 Tax=Cellvibrio polysaccharolyticus TaxID=2082724 RepID=A0A928YV92_9GAMM|nr:YeeE/YedE family protein [Cellvibrio polysaccharolyticus]MBE8716818.1 YeeE/YedE family protein [Cellvibrio polysaccharolyticus]
MPAQAAINPATKHPSRRRGFLIAAVIATLVVITSLIYLSIDQRFVYLLVYTWFGVIYGVFLQYGRFCMASAVRDLFAVGVPRMAVGVLIAVILYAIISALIQQAGFNTFHAHPLGWHIIIGGLLFGLGMVFAGGCASSSLYKTGEGNLGSVLVLFSISFSQAWLASAGGWLNHLVPASWTETAAQAQMPEELSVTDGWFDQFTAGYLWELSGTTLVDFFALPANLWSYLFGNALVVAILPALVILLLLYTFNYRKIYIRNRTNESGLGYELRGVWSMFTQSRNTAIAGLGLGIFAGLQMLVTGELRDHYNIFNFGELLAQMDYLDGLSIQDSVFDPGYWYITTQEAQWGGWFLQLLGVEMMDNIFFGLDNGLPNPLLNAPGMMSIGIILGAAILANITGEFKWKWPNNETVILALVGGALMGIGSRIGMGCNIGAFFATVTNGDISGWIFLAGMIVGGYIAVKGIKAWIDWRLARSGFDF